MNTFNITSRQCCAARALQGWSQRELAERAGLTINPIIAFEKDGNAKPAARTMRRIIQAFQTAGIAFTDNGGVEPEANLVSILEGDSAVPDMMDDIYHTLKEKGGEVLIAGLSEPDPENEELCAAIRKHIDRLTAANIHEKILIEEGEKNFIAPVEWYRSLDENEFSATPYHQYGDKIAVIEWGPPLKVIMLNHPRIAQTFRIMFYALWKKAKSVGVKEAE